jgi:DinB superfamily
MDDPCAECNFVYDLSLAATAGRDVEKRIGEVTMILVAAEVDVRSRTRAEVWSPLEYGCHLRDVLLVQRERVLAARRVNGAVCTPMGREERVEHDGYGDQAPTDVARQLADAATLFSNVLARLAPKDWDLTVVYNYPETHERSLRWLAVHTVHDVQHHLLDIRRQVR